MKIKKQHVGTISGVELIKNREGKLSRHEGIVKSGTGYHKSNKKYDRKGKRNQQLKNQYKEYGSKLLYIYRNVDESKKMWIRMFA